MTTTTDWNGEDFIRENLKPRALSFAPHIRIWTAHQMSRLSRLEELAETDTPPYWAYAWPGGAALVQHLICEPALVQGRSVIDYGAGSGIVGVAASIAGAASVICIDSDPLALTACRLNGDLNDVNLAVASHVGDRTADVVLAGDVFYGEQEAHLATNLLEAHTARGTLVLVGDIGRHWLPHDRLTRLADYSVQDVGDAPAGSALRGHVYRFG